MLGATIDCMNSKFPSDAPFGVCVVPEPVPNMARTVSYPGYVFEILGHAGVGYAEIAWDELPAALPRLRLLLTVGDTNPTAECRAQLTQWVAEGGRWIAVGGVCGVAELFGVSVEAADYQGWRSSIGTLGEGYLCPVAGAPWGGLPAAPLHFFNGLPVQVRDATQLAGVLDAHQRETSRAAICQKRHGRGACLLIAPDITGTVVRIQQGVGVTRDGVSAPDGSAPVGDSVLKSGDGGVLDWIFDRQPVPGVPGLQAFLMPIADAWRDLLLRAIFTQAGDAGLRLPLLWYYPDNRPALAHLSHDSDGNSAADAERLLAVLAEARVPATWCVMVPGYDAATIARIRGAGHELAMHFDAMTAGCLWNAEHFHAQWQALVAVFGGEHPVTNKNHYLRWEGDGELFEWCQGHGIQLDQSKGASKTGEAGFNFGTCRPYFPVDFEGRPYDVLELPTPTQDLVVFAPPDLLEPLLEAVIQVHGILHLLFHPAHIPKPGVAEALLQAVAAAEARGVAWWTAADINRWERARRQAHWSDFTVHDDACGVTLHTGAALAGATVLLPDGGRGAIRLNGTLVATERVERWGQPFQAVRFDAPAGSRWRLTW